MAIIIGHSIEEGYVPYKFKLARTIPLYKKVQLMNMVTTDL